MERPVLHFVARRFTVVLCVATVLATLGAIELFDRLDRGQREDRVAQDALQNARSLAKELAPVDMDAVAIQERVRMWALSNPDVVAVDVLGQKGETIWTSSSDARTRRREPPPLGTIVAQGGWVGATPATRMRHAFVPLHPEGFRPEPPA